ncbi:MAG: VCBS repeat-containing protein [Acidobacteriota bacterium]
MQDVFNSRDSHDLPLHRVRLGVLSGAVGCALLLGAGASVAQTDWVTYVEEPSRLSVAAEFGADDEQEKDFASGDLDKDGDVDVVIARKVPFSVAGGHANVLLMNENGVLTDRTGTLVPAFLDMTDDRDIILADFDGDTWLDMVVAGTFDEIPRIYMNRGETAGGVWLGFAYEEARIPDFDPGPKFCAVAAGDVTGDGRPDLYFTDYDNTLEDRLLINNGSGFFTDETETRMTSAMVDSTFGTDAHIVDVNRDTFLDIVKNNASGETPPPGFQASTTVMYNDGTGNFTSVDTIYEEAGYMIEPADFTGDGFVDFFIVDDGQDRYLRSAGNNAQGFATFTTHTVSTSPNTIFFGGNVKFADLDNDTILDVVIADVDTDVGGCNREPALLRGTGTQPDIDYGDPISGANRPWLPRGVFDIEPMDIDGDGVLDLLMGTCNGTRVFMGVLPNIFNDDFESGDTSRWTLEFP